MWLFLHSHDDRSAILFTGTNEVHDSNMLVLTAVISQVVGNKKTAGRGSYVD